MDAVLFLLPQKDLNEIVSPKEQVSSFRRILSELAQVHVKYCMCSQSFIHFPESF